ncbi:hypothetical protein ACFOMD_03370 [Sphingoaurantiacus capsulatus]|uniref:DUF4142 domain-containing protein n=1 Tax=Sphingoaurantiacus capsulatus TaxID=1771310 RepID=A0ABV7X620_9SPHN
MLRASMVLIGTVSAISVQAQGTAPVSDADWPRGVMRPVAMRDLTPAEQRAHHIWSMRAALNVAALQCQFSPFLRTVKNYNQMLPHHATELASALKTMNGHFVRLDGAKKGRQTFDQYTTKTYNSFSTLEAQLTFCQKASEIGWEMLAAKKGAYADIAATRLPEIRHALIPTTNPLLLVRLGWMDAPRLVDPCVDRKGRAIPLGSKKCS